MTFVCRFKRYLRFMLIGSLFAASAALADDGPVYQLTDGTTVAALDTFKECDACPEMIVMPLGSFMMGAIEGESRNPFDLYGPTATGRVRAPDEINIIPTEHPRHEVEIDIPFAMGSIWYSLAKSPERAADLVQQTFVKWAEKGHQLNDRSKAKTWLFTTLYREHLGQARRSTKFPERELEAAEYQLPAHEASAERKIDAKRAVDLLSQLDETFRAPLTLFFLQEHSYKEIAETLDIPIGTVMSRISRGKKQLRKLMETAPEMNSENVINFQKETR